MSEGNQDNAEYRDLPKWKQDILIADRTLDSAARKLDQEEERLADKYDFTARTIKTLDGVKRYLPEHVPFGNEEFNTGNNNETFRLAFPNSVRKYYLPETHEVFTIESSSLGKLQNPQCYPENADFIGFDELRKNLYHSQLNISGRGVEGRGGVFVRKLDKKKKGEAVNGLLITTDDLYPNESEQLISSAKQLLEQEIGRNKTDEALAEISELFQLYHGDVKELYKSLAPNIRKRLLNLRDSVLRSPYSKFRLPKILEINKYSNDPEFHSYYFLVNEGKLVRSDASPKRNLFRRIQKVPGVTETTDEELVTYSRRIQWGLTSVLPSGWGLWGK